MPSLGQQFRVGYHYVDLLLGWDIDLPAFTCGHCNNCYSPGLARFIHRPYHEVEAEVNRLLNEWKRKVGVCRKCDGFICATCAAVHLDGECFTYWKDAHFAFEDHWKQPWMLRDKGEPVYRLLDQHGEPILVQQRDVGYTDRQMANLAGELNYDGSAKRKTGEQVL